MRWLIFLPTLAAANEIAPQLPGKSAFLNSKTSDIPDDAVFILTTRVADAGLTIPDVSVVITSDVDVTVTTTRDEAGDQFATLTRSVFHRLSEATLRQRRGRTGRTGNGTAYVVHLDRLTESRRVEEFSPSEYDNLIQLLEILEQNPDIAKDLDNGARTLLGRLATDPKVTIAHNRIADLLQVRGTYDDVLIKEFGPGIALTDRPVRVPKDLGPQTVPDRQYPGLIHPPTQGDQVYASYTEET